MPIKLFIFGTGSLSEVAYNYFKENEKFEIVGFVEFKKFIKKNKKKKLPIIEFEKVTKVYPKNKFQGFVAIGPKLMNSLREDVYKKLKKRGIN